MKIVIAEDTEMVRTRIEQRLLGLPGCRLVGAAATWQQIPALVRNTGASVLIADLRLQDGVRLDVLGALRREHPHCRILVFSSMSDSHVREACLQAGAVAFFAKSGGFEPVEDWLSDAVSQKGKVA